MGEENINFNSTQENQTDDFLHVASIKEDWGGDGTGRMNLSGRCTAISQEYVPSKYQFFDTNTVSEKHHWRVNGMPDDVGFGSRRSLTWHDSGASTSKVVLPPNFEAPAGYFTADLEIFVLKGAIQLGEWQLNKHGYSFIPALDSKLLPWGKTDTVQFEQSKKKYLRKANNGGGVWLLTILPHYDSRYPMIQCYNEEAYCLSGYCDIGDFRFVKDCFGYVPSFTISPWHRTDDGCLFFIRVDRDLSKLGTVLSYSQH